MLSAVFKKHALFNSVSAVVLITAWFVLFEKPKFSFNQFGIEFDLYCLLILVYVSIQLVTSLLNGHKLKPSQAQYIQGLKAALIVPVYNEDGISIREGLESCFAQSHTFTQIHITDDGSDALYTETQAWFLKKCTENNIYGTWVRQENAGKREAHENSIQRINKANCDIIVTIDSDTSLDRYAVEKGLIAFQDEKVMSVAGLVISKNVHQSFISRVTDMIFVAHQQLIDRLSAGFFGQVIVNSGGLAFYRRRVVEVALKSGYTSETFNWKKIPFSDDSYFTLAALMCGKTMASADAIAFTDMPALFDHHRRQQLRWFRGSFIRGIWRIRYLRPTSFGWIRQYLAWIVFFSSCFMLIYLLAFHFFYTLETLLPLAIFSSYIYGLRYFQIKRSDVSLLQAIITYLLSPLAIFWSMFVLRFLRLYGIWTNTKHKWGTRQKVEIVRSSK